MSPNDIFILNLGADKQFKHALQHVTGVVQTYAESTNSADVRAATTRSVGRIGSLLSEPIGLLHVMGHGDESGLIYSGDRRLRRPRIYSMDDLQDWVDRSNEPLRVDAVLLDACDTFSRAWRNKVRSLIAPNKSVVMIGTTRSVGWDEASTYVGGFYAALLRKRFPTYPARRRAAVLDAHTRSARSYRILLDAPAPFGAVELTA